MLLERASANGPPVVSMEDIDWADECTRHLLRLLARGLTDGPMMIITSGGGRTLRARRNLLDRLLLDAAASAGAEVPHETTATALS
jgi:flavin-dependent dehydrogenase